MLNQIKRWFALITILTIRRDSFDSVADFKRKIGEFVKCYNQHPKPFMRTVMAESILAKIGRYYVKLFIFCTRPVPTLFGLQRVTA